MSTSTSSSFTHQSLYFTLTDFYKNPKPTFYPFIYSSNIFYYKKITIVDRKHKKHCLFPFLFFFNLQLITIEESQFRSKNVFIIREAAPNRFLQRRSTRHDDGSSNQHRSSATTTSTVATPPPPSTTTTANDSHRREQRRRS